MNERVDKRTRAGDKSELSRLVWRPRLRMMTEYENSACTGTGASRLRWRDGPRCDFVGEITCLMDIIGCLVGLGSIGCDSNQILFGVVHRGGLGICTVLA